MDTDILRGGSAAGTMQQTPRVENNKTDNSDINRGGYETTKKHQDLKILPVSGLPILTVTQLTRLACFFISAHVFAGYIQFRKEVVTRCSDALCGECIGQFDSMLGIDLAHVLSAQSARASRNDPVLGRYLWETYMR
jgi:hypothetical protein